MIGALKLSVLLAQALSGVAFAAIAFAVTSSQRSTRAPVLPTVMDGAMALHQALLASSDALTPPARTMIEPSTT